MSWKRGLKRFGRAVLDSLAAEFGVDVVRGYVIERLSKVTPQQFYDSIQSGNLDIWSATSDVDRRYGARWARKYSHLRDRFTWENVFTWLCHDRPDLASVVLNLPSRASAEKLLREKTEEFKSHLWPQAKG